MYQAAKQRYQHVELIGFAAWYITQALPKQL
jgi:hypothetical protein